jgi:hypothetical protein
LVDSLKALDPERPIREADIANGFPLRQRPKFNPTSPLSRIADYKRVVLEIEGTDAVSTGWAVGYYLVPGGPDDVIEILGPPNNPFFSG